MLKTIFTLDDQQTIHPIVKSTQLVLWQINLQIVDLIDSF